jgi:hypothetical protein
MDVLLVEDVVARGRGEVLRVSGKRAPANTGFRNNGWHICQYSMALVVGRKEDGLVEMMGNSRGQLDIQLHGLRLTYIGTVEQAAIP